MSLKFFKSKGLLSSVCLSVSGSVCKLFYFIQFLRIHSKDSFQTLQHDRGQQLDKNRLSDICQKILIWAKWTILTQFGSAPRIFFKLCRIRGVNK